MTDTTTNPFDLAHLVVLHGDDRCGYQPVCSCGWLGTWNDYVTAADAGGEHRDGAVGPPDEMDRLMRGLLDLQDDLAAVVVWLAENWTADLPRLGWSASGDDRQHDRPAVRVLGYCEPSELAAAAAALGAAATDDPLNDRGHTRYRRAVRDFGRVRIDIFTALADAVAAEATP
jgi:hypothetical protein